MGNHSVPSQPALGRTARLICGCAAAWSLIATISALQGQLLSEYHGRQQAWFPSLGYSFAIFSIWALLSPAALWLIANVNAERAWVRRILGHAISLVAFISLHVAIFVLIYWPVYGQDAASPFAMAEPVLLANMDKAIFAYAALLAITHARRRLRDFGDANEKPISLPSLQKGLWIRTGGSTHFVPFPDIDTITAAGDYVEVRASAKRFLADQSLSKLAKELPQDQFARIHRSTIIRLDRVREVRRIGRGDAEILLHNGAELRLSRRYREEVTTRLPL